MKVWIAQEVFDYEGSHILGVKTTETKAMQACEDEWGEKSERKLVWKNGMAQGHNSDHRFSVTWYEVDRSENEES